MARGKFSNKEKVGKKSMVFEKNNQKWWGLLKENFAKMRYKIMKKSAECMQRESCWIQGY
ncbi:MAG: hypothetical protein ACTSRK_12160 [Promethearchaeota archaeon]